MKSKLKKFSVVFSAFLLGFFFPEIISIFSGSWFTFKNLLVDQAFWSAVGTFMASMVALFIAYKGWNKAEKSRRLSELVKRAADADMTYLYFHCLSRKARLVNIEGFSTPEFEEAKFEEIYKGWSSSFSDERMTECMVRCNNLSEISVIDDMEIRLNKLNSCRNGNQEDIDFCHKKRIWEDVACLLEVVSSVSHLNLLEIRVDCYKIDGRSVPEDIVYNMEASKTKVEKSVAEYKNTSIDV